MLLFHYGIPPFRGGYVGVDVFFVISGYLITANTLADLRRQRFSILAFYERRIRRILPALLVVIGACGLASAFVFLPNDQRVVGSGLTAAATFTSNLLFAWVAQDYFAAGDLELQPMLHTWSLAVEAQFYLVFPWLMWAVGRRHWRASLVLGGLAGLSFAASVWGVSRAPELAFYSLPTRAWELLVGALLAHRSGLGGPSGRDAAVAAGLGLVGVSAVVLTKATPFPGVAAVPACVGAALMIGAGGAGGRVSAVLARSPFVGIGRVSYSLYLWHWPLLVFASYGRSAAPSIGERVGLMATALALAIASWRWVERPMIARRWLGDRTGLLGAASVGTLAAALLGVAIGQIGRGTLPLTFLPASVVTLANGQFDWIGGDCRPDDAAAATQLPCRFGDPGAEPSVVAWGNSYMRMWVPTLDLDARDRGAAGIALLRVRCLPLVTPVAGQPRDCAAFNAAALDYILGHPDLRTVVLGANWFVAGAALEQLGATVERLQGEGRRVVVVVPPPLPTYLVPRTLAMAALRGEPPPPPVNRAEARAAQQDSIDIILALQAQYGFEIVDPATRMCDTVTCPVERDGHALFSDTDHVSLTAARAARGLFAAVLGTGDPPHR